MRIGKYNIKNVTKDYCFDKGFGFHITHRYWHLWNVWIDLVKYRLYLEICRTDWNKCYKEKCVNYTKKCKHNIECNECMICFKTKEK